MITPPCIKRSHQQSIRTIKTPLILGVGGFVLLFGLLIGNVALANFPAYWNDDFETYATGDLQGKDAWSGSIYYDVTTNSSFVTSGAKGIGVFAWQDYGQTITRIIPEEYRVDTALVNGWYYLNTPIRVGAKDTQVRYLYTYLYSTYYAAQLYNDATGLHNYDLYYASAKFNCQTGAYLGVGGAALYNLIPPNSWVTIHYELDLTNNLIYFSYTLSGGSRVDWSKDNNICFWHANPRADIIFYKIQFEGRLATSFGFDNINTIAPCGLTSCGSCEDWFSCQVGGCCWYYQPLWPPPFDNYCGDCEGVCNYENCGLCENQTECEAVDCYWTGDYCSWIVSECGSGLACQFCESQSTCEAEGCNWYAPTGKCWYEPPTLPLTSWETYYNEYGDYETPAPFVDNLAETLADNFATLSSFFEGFASSFNTNEAMAKGVAIGSAIPQARGYLKIIDELMGHLPVGELFVFALIFLLAIGVFRITRHSTQMVKP